MYMRLWTVAFACSFALVSGLNTVDLITEIYHNGVLRDALVGAGQQVAASASTVLDPRNTPPSRYTAALKDAVKDLAPPLTPPSILTPRNGVDWIKANVPAAQEAAVEAAFTSTTSASDQAALAANQETAEKLLAITNKAGIQVLALHWPPTSQRWGVPS